MTAHAPAAAIVATQDETIAIVAERRLSVAALTALLLKDPDYRLVFEARGSTEVRDALAWYRPLVMVDARDSAFPSPDGPSDRVETRLVVRPEDCPDDFASSVQAAIKRAQAMPVDSGSRRLSGREQEILIQVARGKSTKEIARAYAITPKTVGNHVGNIRQKLHLHHRGQLVLFAVEQGLASP